MYVKACGLIDETFEAKNSKNCLESDESVSSKVGAASGFIVIWFVFIFFPSSNNIAHIFVTYYFPGGNRKHAAQNFKGD